MNRYIIKLIIIAVTLNTFSILAQVEQTSTVFNAGKEHVNSYRIPSIITAKDGSLIVFCEARHESWRDKSHTDIVMKRSTDNGKTWSSTLNLTNGKTGAYMDPTAVVDKKSGKIFLFTTFWPADNHTGTANLAFLITSSDNGKTWTNPINITSKVFKNSIKPLGFGPGNGIQIAGNKYKNRLVIPIRAHFPIEGTRVATIYSDNGGKDWTVGKPGENDDELQIAESPRNTIIYNARTPGARMVAHSYNGGETWTSATKDTYLPAASKGCHSSILAKRSTLYFCGIEGIKETADFDERGRLMLFKSNDGGNSWNKGTLLYDKAAGYSSMTFLKNGKIAIVFETTDSRSFTRRSIPDTNPPKRPEGWMRLDVMIVNPSKL